MFTLLAVAGIATVIIAKLDDTAQEPMEEHLGSNPTANAIAKIFIKTIGS